MFYTNRIFSKLHTKCEKDLKSAEMTTNKCVVHGKVTETNLVKKKLGIYWGKKSKELIKNGMPKKTILKYVKCQWEEMIHIKKLVKIFKAKTNC